jgi:DNA-binding XRE family transcriptional regulator
MKPDFFPFFKLAHDIAQVFGVPIEEIFIFGTSDIKGSWNG